MVKETGRPLLVSRPFLSPVSAGALAVAAAVVAAILAEVGDISTTRYQKGVVVTIGDGSRLLVGGALSPEGVPLIGLTAPS